MSSKKSISKEIDLLMGLPYDDYESHIINQIFEVMTTSEITQMLSQMPNEEFTKKIQKIITENREIKINQIIK